MFPEHSEIVPELFDDYVPDSMDEEDFSVGSSDDYVPETDEEAEADAELRAGVSHIVTTVREENSEVDQGMEEAELKTTTRKRKVKSRQND